MKVISDLLQMYHTPGKRKKIRFCCLLPKDNFVAQTIKKTIVILDNSPIHRSKKFKAKIQEWREQDVYIFFLPPYSPELNLIEILWRRIKYQWLSFDAYLCFQNLKERLSYVLNNFGGKYDIIF